jgi:TPR repeat protein
VEQDYLQAAEYLHQLAEENDAAAQQLLATYYHYGYAVERDYNKAYELYLSAANQGNIAAQYGLAICYYYGLGVERDKAEFDKWIKLAAQNGHPESTTLVAQLGL